MKKVGIIAVVFALVATAFTMTTLWKVIDPEKVVVNFKLMTEGTSGTFTGIDASFDINEEDLSKSVIKASVNVKSLKTDNAKRDGHLMTPDFFDAAKYPTITYVSTAITKTATGFMSKGKLTMKGQTFDVDVPFVLEQDKDGNASFKGTMEVVPYQFGVMKGEKSKSEKASISVEIPLKK